MIDRPKGAAGFPRSGAPPPAKCRPLAEVIACWLLSVAAVAAPVALGCSGAWAKVALEAAMTVAVLLWLASARRPASASVFPLVVAGLLLLQVTPLPESFLVWLAPISAGSWKVAPGATRSWATAAVDPAASMAAMRSVLIGLAAIVAVTGLGRYQSHRRRLLAAVALSGAVILGLGLAFGPADANHIVLGFVDLKGVTLPTHNALVTPMQSSGGGVRETVEVAGFRYFAQAAGIGDGFGSYIYSNHYAGGLVLTLPVALATWVRISRGRLPMVARIMVSLLLAGLAVWTVALRAESRAGTLSLALSLAALAALTAARLWHRILAYSAFGMMTAATLCIVGLLVFAFSTGNVGWVPLFEDRVVTIMKDPRTIAAQVAVRMFRASPIFGTGLDSYRLIFPRFEDDRFGLYYAHNEYAQILAETGLVGAAVVAWMLVLLGNRCFRFCRGASGDYRVLNAGPWAAVAGMAAHSAFDWNLHLPANAYLACLVAGLAYSSVPPPANRKAAWWCLIPEWLPRAVLAIGCIVALLFNFRDGVSAAVERQLREAIVAARMAGRVPQVRPPDEDLRDAIEMGIHMAPWDWENARLMILLGQAHLHVAQRVVEGVARDQANDAAASWFERATGVAAECQGIAKPIAGRR